MNRLALLLPALTGMISAQTIHNFKLRSIDGGETPLAGYKGKVVLLVNTASQ